MNVKLGKKGISADILVIIILIIGLAIAITIYLYFTVRGKESGIELFSLINPLKRASGL